MSFFAGALAILEASRYAVLFVGCFIEGPIVMMTGGFLARLGVVAFFLAYGVLVAADWCSDIFLYGVGYVGARAFLERWGRLFGISKETLARAEMRFKEHHTTILIISKLTMGFGISTATLLTAGMLRISLLRYAVIQFLGSLVWVFALMMIGYFYGNLLSSASAGLQAAIAIATIVVIFIALQFFGRRVARTEP